MYAKRYKNKKGEEKVEILLSLEEAQRAVKAPEDLLIGIKKALGEPILDGAGYVPRGTPGNLDGLKILFDDIDQSPGAESAE